MATSSLAQMGLPTSSQSHCNSRTMKRSRRDDPMTDFGPLEITDDILDDRTLEGPWFTSVRCIPFDPDSPPCLNADLASAQATLMHKTTESNEVFLRTHHPALKSFTSVWLMKERSGRQIWVLRDAHENCNYTHAGGLEIHQTPRVTFYQTNGVFLYKHDTIRRAINPRAALSNEDLSKFRDMFPFAVGVRVYVGGGIVVLYRNPTELYASLDRGVAYTVSGWDVAFDVMETTPTTSILDLGEQITTENSMSYPTACIGVRIRLPSGQPALTTVTHGFVSLPGTGCLAKAFGWMWRKKEALLRFKTPRTRAADLPLIGPQPIGSKSKSFASWFTTNSPIGKPVFLHSTSKAIGSIGSTFDAPSSFSPYPSGYICDLSLIVPENDEAEGFPEIGSPSGIPTIDGWADLKRALGGDSVFVTANLTIESGRQTKTGKVLTPSEYLDVQDDLAELKREAMIEVGGIVVENVFCAPCRTFPCARFLRKRLMPWKGDRQDGESRSFSKFPGPATRTDRATPTKSPKQETDMELERWLFVTGLYTTMSYRNPNSSAGKPLEVLYVDV